MSVRKIALALALTGATAGTASAQDITGNVALATDYIFRGVTQTDNGPAISGGFDVEAGGAYAGVWGSSVDFSDATTMELDLYGGYAWSAGGFDFDLGGSSMPIRTARVPAVTRISTRSMPVSAASSNSWPGTRNCPTRRISIWRRARPSTSRRVWVSRWPRG